jgi:hypothetical protein
MVIHVEVARVYSACGLPGAYTRIKQHNIRKGERSTSWLVKGQLAARMSRRDRVSLHGEGGEAIEVFEARMEGVFPFLQ